ncbi:hypothetical protein [Pedobacter gandavensis]|uniref:RuvC-like resolvase n=1 Tax=Pedobacter gandavensis TaxID=2679963 RepID=A0ABR6EWL3_9SPHI|nr:hypothetical protein [Pedobacter gandavensis]MBB2148828.1 hypothetical protein [Pedobacter gandavensis]
METNKKLLYVIGIDPGTKTGLAVYCRLSKKLTLVKTLMIHEAFKLVQENNQFARDNDQKIFVRVEDARKRKRYGANSQVKVQGAGAIKIQCKQWEEFLISEGISYQMVAPQSIRTKVDSVKFKQITRWDTRTSNHGRDAGMLVYGL